MVSLLVKLKSCCTKKTKIGVRKTIHSDRSSSSSDDGQESIQSYQSVCADQSRVESHETTVQMKKRRKRRRRRKSSFTHSKISFESFNSQRKRERIRRRNYLKKGNLSPRRVVEISGQPISNWKKDDLLGLYDLVDCDRTGRPVYKRRLPNNLNKNVHLFYRVESEKWCLGPEPNGTYCWIYCDSKSKWPWLKTLRPFWHEHTGGNEWVNIPIKIESAKKSTVNEENSK